MKLQPFQQRVSKPTPLGPEHNPWFWNPFRQSIRRLDGPVGDRIRTDFPGIEITWNPIIERWQAWARAARIQHPLCNGWKLLFIHNEVDRSYCPPDERLLARLELCDGQRVRMNQLQHFDRVQAEKQRDQELADRAFSQGNMDEAMSYYDYSRIKNIGSGSKFSTYFS